jgi:hypothetical protein
MQMKPKAGRQKNKIGSLYHRKVELLQYRVYLEQMGNHFALAFTGKMKKSH